ncbi:MAG TPA: hypothetical protein VN456_07380 [Desulfosporosinus sp.]|nr:hypothetical protein [Desulfosporosinus sp.]
MKVKIVITKSNSPSEPALKDFNQFVFDVLKQHSGKIDNTEVEINES